MHVREGLEALGLEYAVGISHPTTVWATRTEPIPAKPYGDIGKPATLLNCDANHQLVSVKALAESAATAIAQSHLA